MRLCICLGLLLALGTAGWAQGKAPEKKETQKSVSHPIKEAKDGANEALNEVDRGIHKAIPAVKEGAESALNAVDEGVHKVLTPKKK